MRRSRPTLGWRWLTFLAPAAISIAYVPAATAQRPAKQTPPPVGRPKDFRLPEKRDFTLPNGMAVTLVRFGTVPMATVTLGVQTGSIDERPNEVWLSEVTGDLLEQGTASLSASQLAERTASMGGSLDVTVGQDRTNIGGDVLAEHAPEMVRIVADVARNPRLPDSELPRITTDRLRSLAIARSTPQSIAQERFAAILYGDHPYGRLYPTDAMLQGYTIRQVRDFFARNVGARRSHLYVVGVFDDAAVESAVRQAFAGWAAGPAPRIDVPTPKSGRTLTLLDRPNAPQSTIILGLPVPPPQSRDFVALSVTDALLGGTFGSRITTNIREQKGYTYSPFSFVSTRRRDAVWQEQADVTTKFTGPSLKEIFGEIDRLRREAPPQAELRGVQNNMAGIFTLQNGSRQGITGQLEFVDLQGLGDAYLTNYVKHILAVSPVEVRRIARSYLRPDRMAIVVVGDKKVIADQVAPYNAVVP